MGLKLIAGTPPQTPAPTFQQDLCGIEALGRSACRFAVMEFQQDLCGIEAAKKSITGEPAGWFQQDLCGIEANRALGGNP